VLQNVILSNCLPSAKKNTQQKPSLSSVFLALGKEGLCQVFFPALGKYLLYRVFF
jgi:hypothetical protein